MLMKTIKIRKTSKLQNFEKQNKWSGDMVIICFMGSEKTGFMDDGHPRDDSSSAVQ